MSTPWWVPTSTATPIPVPLSPSGRFSLRPTPVLRAGTAAVPITTATTPSMASAIPISAALAVRTMATSSSCLSWAGAVNGASPPPCLRRSSAPVSAIVARKPSPATTVWCSTAIASWLNSPPPSVWPATATPSPAKVPRALLSTCATATKSSVPASTKAKTAPSAAGAKAMPGIPTKSASLHWNVVSQ